MTPIDIVIRSAVAEDVPLILSYIRELADYEKLSSAVVADEATLHETLFGEYPAAEILLAHVDGAPAGFALFFHNYSTFLGRPGLYLEDLFVRPDFRGHGVGRTLLARLAALAVERNCGRFEWSVLDWNEPAQDFYSKLGARPMDDWTLWRMDGQALINLAEETS